MRKSYFSLVGDNAVGVVGSWEMVEKLSKYVKKIAYSQFDDFAAAEAFALEQFYNRIYGNRPIFKGERLEHLLLNNIIFKKYLKI